MLNDWRARANSVWRVVWNFVRQLPVGLQVALFVVAVIFIAWVVWQFGYVRVAATLAALFFFWGMDVAIKDGFGIGNETMFVDLAFTALVIALGFVIKAIQGEDGQSIGNVFPLLTLFALYIAAARAHKPGEKGDWTKWLSFVAASLSAIVLLFYAA